MLRISTKRPIYHVTKDHRGNVLEDTRPCQRCQDCGAHDPKGLHFPCTGFKTELTAIGEQYVVPGCEKKPTPKARQLGLWDV